MQNLTLPESLRPYLQKIHGRLITIEKLKATRKKFSKIITVGDVCSMELLKNGITPDVSVIDYQTKRLPVADVRKFFENYPMKTILAKNPAGTITAELWKAVRRATKCTELLRIEVVGEEDLVVPVIIMEFPVGCGIIYGVPDRGMAILKITEKLKKECSNLLKAMSE